MSGNSKTAVIIVNYNGIEDSMECMESIYKGTCHDELTIIFIDNASEKDETEAAKKRFPNIVTIRSENNGGFSSGNNLGIRYAIKEGYDNILLLNNDTVIAPDMIQLLKKYCTEETVAVPKMLYYAEPHVIWYGGGKINRWTGNGVHLKADSEDTDEQEPVECTFSTGCCMMAKTSTFEKVGLWKEDFFMYCEDMEFCIRLALNKIKIKYVPAAKLWHKVGRSSGGNQSPFSTYYITRNRLNCVKKYHSYFACTAYPFSLLSRYVRLFLCRDKAVKNAFRRGIQDHLKGISGKFNIM